jgi:hypothetical protein
MDKIGDLIGKRLNQHKLGESARASAIVHKANLFLREKFPESEDEVRAFRLKDGILYIGTAGAVWSQEVHGCQSQMIEVIGREYGEKSVVKVVIKGLTTK